MFSWLVLLYFFFFERVDDLAAADHTAADEDVRRLVEHERAGVRLVHRAARSQRAAAGYEAGIAPLDRLDYVGDFRALARLAGRTDYLRHVVDDSRDGRLRLRDRAHIRGMSDHDRVDVLARREQLAEQCVLPRTVVRLYLDQFVLGQLRKRRGVLHKAALGAHRNDVAVAAKPFRNRLLRIVAHRGGELFVNHLLLLRTSARSPCSRCV